MLVTVIRINILIRKGDEGNGGPSFSTNAEGKTFVKGCPDKVRTIGRGLEEMVFKFQNLKANDEGWENESHSPVFSQ